MTAESAGLRKNKGKEVFPVVASITIEGSNFTVTTGSKYGNYYRPLAPGKYTVIVTSEGYSAMRANITVPSSGSGVKKDFVLKQKRPDNAQASKKDLPLTMTSAEQQRDNLVLLLGGVLILYGLWLTHRQAVHRYFNSSRERSM